MMVPVDSHPFWQQYLLILRPDVKDEPARQSQSLFDLAHKATHGVCLPCMIITNRRLVTSADGTTMTSMLGKLPTCRHHLEKFCTHCLRINPIPPNSHLGLKPSENGDQDEHGRPRPRGRWVVCYHCREVAMAVAVRRELVECARGGPVLGITAPFHMTQSYREYTLAGRGRVDSMAKRAVDEMCLMQQTRWVEIEACMTDLQRHLIKLRCIFYDTRQPRPSPHDLDLWNQYCNRIWAMGAGDPPDLGYMYRLWANDIETREYTEHDWREDYERSRSMEPPRLWPFLREKLVHQCIDYWINDRVQNGYWIMPSDEVEQAMSLPETIHTRFTAQDVRHPHSDAPLAISDHRFTGRFHFGSPAIHSQYYLPSSRLLAAMDEKFTSQLGECIRQPLYDIVECHRMQSRENLDAAETQCAGMNMERILEFLGLHEAWIDGGLANTRSLTLVAHMPSDPGGGTVVSDLSSPAVGPESPRSAPKSPHIELVLDESHVHEDFGIVDGWSSSVRDEDALSTSPEATPPADVSPMSTSPKFGKRKSTEEDKFASEDRPQRPRLSSGQTSHTSEGSSTPALVTPDDSPDLLAGTIQLADEAAVTAHVIDGAALNGDINVAISRNGSVGDAPTSPNLGKRKSPEDDEREQRPARRHESRPPSEHELVDGDKGDAVCEDVVTASAEREVARAEDIKVTCQDEVVTSIETPVPEKQNIMATLAPVEPPVAPKTESATPVSVESTGIRSPYFDSPARAVSPSSSLMSSEFDESEFSDGYAPYVPCPYVKLGPGATAIIRDEWYRAREPLRECQCRICHRARKDENDRILFSNFGSLENQILRIA